MVEAINTWIQNGCKYRDGVALYELYGKNKFLKAIFTKSETAVNRQKLNAELTGLRDAAPVVVPPVAPVYDPSPAAPPVQTTPPSVIKQKPKQLPNIMLVREQIDRNYNEIRSLHPYLTIHPDGDQKKDIAARMVRLGKENAKLWETYNYLTEHGPAAATPPPPELSLADLMRKRENIRKSLNKAENRIKGSSKPKQKSLDLIAGRRQDLKELDEKIAAINAAIKNGGDQ